MSLAAARRAVGVLALIVAVVAVVPPVLTSAANQEELAALQFGLLGIVVPPLLVLAAPARRARWAARLADRRRRHPEVRRAFGFLAIELAALVVWRLPPVVDALARQRLLVLPEAITLVGAGCGLWLECLESPPLAPRVPPGPWRALWLAIAMWVTWLFAYIAAFSHPTWYPAYRVRVPGGMSPASAEQLGAGVLWFLAAAAFVPAIFYNLLRWLQSEEQPDAELQRLVREEHRRSG